MTDTETVRIPKTVYDKAGEIASDRGMSLKEAIRYMCREGGYDV